MCMCALYYLHLLAVCSIYRLDVSALHTQKQSSLDQHISAANQQRQVCIAYIVVHMSICLSWPPSLPPTLTPPSVNGHVQCIYTPTNVHVHVCLFAVCVSQNRHQMKELRAREAKALSEEDYELGGPWVFTVCMYCTCMCTCTVHTCICVHVHVHVMLHIGLHCRLDGDSMYTYNVHVHCNEP